MCKKRLTRLTITSMNCKHLLLISTLIPLFGCTNQAAKADLVEEVRLAEKGFND